tara:strand:+ start:1517 stop:1813 length:297 start_codon:yes stop_codon:yes gene_type:complete
MKFEELGRIILEKKIRVHSRRIWYFWMCHKDKYDTVEEFLDSGFTICTNPNKHGDPIVPNWEREFIRTPNVSRKSLEVFKEILRDCGYNIRAGIEYTK